MRGVEAGRSLGGLLVALWAAAVGSAAVLSWPVPHPGFVQGEAPETYLQATQSGRWESALFGCVRNDGHRFHEGLDLAPIERSANREARDAIFAAFDGRVAYVNPVAGNSGYGRYVVLVHDDLSPAVYTLYSHLARIAPEVAEGQRVRSGQRLGTMGRSARYHIPRSRAHLHFELGLRLTDKFAPWYARQGFGTENDHGRYNGMNLVGFDPLAFFRSQPPGTTPDLAAVWRELPVGLVLEVRLATVPDFARRYPSLVTRRIDRNTLAGWRLRVTPWGLPLYLTPLGEDEVTGLTSPGQVRITGIAPDGLDAFACRDMVQRDRQGRYVLDEGGQRMMELLFGLR